MKGTVENARIRENIYINDLPQKFSSINLFIDTGEWAFIKHECSMHACVVIFYILNNFHKTENGKSFQIFSSQFIHWVVHLLIACVKMNFQVVTIRSPFNDFGCIVVCCVGLCLFVPLALTVLCCSCVCACVWFSGK